MMTYFSQFQDFVNQKHPYFSKGLSFLPPLMVSPFEIKVPIKDMNHIREFIDAILRLNHSPIYSKALGVSRVNDSPIMGFDFYMTTDGPKLIEINTNPAALLLAMTLHEFKGLATSQVSEPSLFQRLHQRFSQAMRGHHLIVILDETPSQQHTYFEFQWFKALFEQWGWECLILAPEDLSSADDYTLLTPDGRAIAVIYNRYCDFLLESPVSQPLLKAFTAGKVQLLPSPVHYQLLSDKYRLTQWSSPEFLSALGVSDTDKAIIAKVIPPVTLISPDTVDEIWAMRKSLFFKPAQGYGSRGVYKGKSISRPTFNRLIEHPTIAQPYFNAPTYHGQYDGQDLEFKYDVRVYVVDGDIVLSAARLFKGQVTNLQTEYGGFAPVYPF